MTTLCKDLTMTVLLDNKQRFDLGPNREQSFGLQMIMESKPSFLFTISVAVSYTHLTLPTRS